MKRLFTLFMLIITSTMLIAGCNFDSSSSKSSGEKKAGEKAEAKQVLNVTATSEIATVDPAQVHDILGFTVLNNVNEGLYRQDENNQPQPALAEDHKVNEDETIHTFTIRDAKWSNGDPVTAHDFEYGWKRVFKETGHYMSMFETAGIKNAVPIMNEEMDVEELGVKALDEKTLEVTLEKPNPLIETLLTFGTFVPQNEKFIKEAGEKFGLEADKVLANGPFKLAEWKHDQSFKYVKNPEYWDADAVKLEEINVFIVKDASTGVNLWDTGKIDRVELTAAYVDQYKDKKEFKDNALALTGFLRFNHHHDVLKNKNIRKAISLGIDKEGLTNVIMKNGASPLYGIVPAGYFFSPDKKDFRELNGNINKGTAEEAKQYWDKGLEEIGKSEVKISLHLADVDLSKKVAEYLQGELEKNLPGLTLELKPVPFEQRLELEKAVDYDISLSTWGPDYSDPMTYIDMWTTGNAANRMDYSNPDYDQLVEKAMAETDMEKRFDMLLQLEKIFLEEDVAITPLYQDGEAIMIHSKVKNLVRHPSGPEFTYKWAYIE